MQFILECIKSILNAMVNTFSIGDLVLYVLGLIFSILPASPIQGMINLLNFDDLSEFDSLMNFVNFFIPFDTFCLILGIWIPFVSLLFTFKVSWRFIWEKIKIFMAFFS